MEALRGLREIHSRGIVHRDYKPHNVLMFCGGCAKLADFNSARVLSDPDKGCTLTGTGSVRKHATDLYADPDYIEEVNTAGQSVNIYMVLGSIALFPHLSSVVAQRVCAFVCLIPLQDNPEVRYDLDIYTWATSLLHMLCGYRAADTSPATTRKATRRSEVGGFISKVRSESDHIADGGKVDSAVSAKQSERFRDRLDKRLSNWPDWISSSRQGDQIDSLHIVIRDVSFSSSSSRLHYYISSYMGPYPSC